MHFNSLQFFQNLQKFSSQKPLVSLGIQKNLEKLGNFKINAVLKIKLENEQPQIVKDEVEENKELDDLSIQVDSSIQDQTDLKVLNTDKYDLYRPTQEQIEELKEVVQLSDKASILSEMVPNKIVASVSFDYSRLYNGRFTPQGNLYYCTSQDSIGLFNTKNPYEFEHINTIEGRNVSWTISSVDITQDEEKLAYSTLSPLITIVDLYTLSKFHHCIDLRQDSSGNITQGRFRCGGCKFSGDGTEILAGSHCKGIAVYDLIKQHKTITITKAHDNDINSVCFANRTNSHIIYTGSDDCLIKVWDRRILDNSQPIGCFIGHSEGITYVDSRGDERYLVSASKDQTLKLWDLRKMNTIEECKNMTKLKSVYGFDYRMHDYPYPHNPNKHDLDRSVCTFTGFKCLQTNIRAYFSPAETTGQRYIYTGSADGCIYIYDILTGENKCCIDSKSESVLRDVSWHPKLPFIAATSFLGNINIFEFDATKEYQPKNRR